LTGKYCQLVDEFSIPLPVPIVPPPILPMGGGIAPGFGGMPGGPGMVGPGMGAPGMGAMGGMGAGAVGGNRFNSGNRGAGFRNKRSVTEEEFKRRR